jgi:hypothetical protein
VKYWRGKEAGLIPTAWIARLEAGTDATTD